MGLHRCRRSQRLANRQISAYNVGRVTRGCGARLRAHLALSMPGLAHEVQPRGVPAAVCSDQLRDLDTATRPTHNAANRHHPTHARQRSPPEMTTSWGGIHVEQMPGGQASRPALVGKHVLAAAWRPSRRAFVQGAGALGLGLLAGCGRWPLPSEAPQRSRAPRVGYLTPNTQVVSKSRDEAFQQGLQEHGWVAGDNIIIEWRHGDGSAEPLRALAAELVALPVDVMVTWGAATPTARRVTDAIPIVMAGTVDPVEQGLVASLARPGGNITGTSTLERPLTAKRLELLRDGVPGMSQVAVLWSGTNSAVALAFHEAEAAANALHLELLSVAVQNLDDLAARFDAATQGASGGLLVLSDSQMRGDWDRIAAFGREQGLPTMFPDSQMRRGLMAYGPNLPSMVRRSAYHVDRILRGTKPADLPVEQAREFEFVVNLRTAQALGLTIPHHVLLQATEIIQ